MDRFQNLQRSLVSWEGTPYREGHRIFRQGVDCVQFVAAVLDELFQTSSKIPRLSAACALHDDKSSYSTVRALLDAFPSDKVSSVEPGDIVISYCKPTGTHTLVRPHHCLIVSEDPNIFFHAISPTGVCRTAASCWVPHSIYRPRRKETWDSQN